jgi:hypothetical protein
MEPITTTVGLMLTALAGREAISFAEAKLLHALIGSIAEVFKSAERTCTDANHKCNYRNGACYVLMKHGKDWRLSDIKDCKYREPISGGR